MRNSLYPKYQAARGGCKVGWYYYKDEADALKAAEIAKQEADRLWALGYDFGYQCPGDIRLVKEGEYAGLYCVTTP